VPVGIRYDPIRGTLEPAAIVSDERLIGTSDRRTHATG